MATKLESKEQPDTISAAPTKSFFVDMLTRDIPLEQAILDLVDNCVDGATRMNSLSFEGRKIDITLNGDVFRILDNCGGFSKDTARNYAFRFGRPTGTPTTPHSIGQFGVGMKRALFKFGDHFTVRSATTTETWAIEVDVKKWVADTDNWHFRWSNFGKESSISKSAPGTDITVTKLRPEVADRFGSQQFVNGIVSLIKSKHRQFLSSGLTISINDTHVTATDVYLLKSDKLQPGVDTLKFGSGKSSVQVKIVVGLGPSSPREAGWYVICNGRVILDADRRERTGWGLIEQSANSESRVAIPSYHNQFARFRGIVSFDSQDAAQLPWNTTKTDIDDGNIVWQKAFQRMTEMMRPVITFLNELDKDIDEHSRDGSPLLDHVSSSEKTTPEKLPRRAEFRAPARGEISKREASVKIQYSRPLKDVQFLERTLGLTSAKAVGEKTFDMILSRQKKQ